MTHDLHIAVIADDLTGAADTGVQFCPAIGPVHLASAAEGTIADEAVHAGGMAVFTNSRHADPPMAARIVRLAAKGIQRLDPKIVYKKIDSCLRGNLGAEIDALLLATDATASFVAPALPQQGRTTVDDRHLINGVPVADTEVGRDPRCPVKESRLSVLLASQSRFPVGPVALNCFEHGSVVMAQRVRNLLDRGCRHITFDARRTSHLDAIASLARDHFKDVLLVGSAGLARSLSQMIALDAPFADPPKRTRIRKWLFVCGSASRVLAEQVAVLVGSTGWTHLAMAPIDLSAANRSTSKKPLLVQRTDASDAGGVVLSIQPFQSAGPAQDPNHVVQGLAQAATGLIDSVAPQGVFLSGGETAEAFWRAIEARALLIREEILPGLVLGEFIGGPHHGLSVVTKAGAFGDADALTQLIRRLQ